MNLTKLTTLPRISPTLLTRTISTNFSGSFYATQAAARQMALSQSPPGGSIIGVSSISALVGGGGQTHYTPTKAGVLSLMQSCAVALGKYNIRCNALLPGTIRTQMNEEDLRDEGKRGYMEGRVPLGRLGRPEDLAGPAVFLACGKLSGYVVSSFSLILSEYGLWMGCLTEYRQGHRSSWMEGCSSTCSDFISVYIDLRSIYYYYLRWYIADRINNDFSNVVNPRQGITSRSLYLNPIRLDRNPSPNALLLLFTQPALLQHALDDTPPTTPRDLIPTPSDVAHRPV